MILDQKPPLDEALLAHHGVKGMKWGVHKKEELVGRSSSAKETSGSSSSTAEYKAIKPKKAASSKEAIAAVRKNQQTFLEKANPSEAGTTVKKGLSPEQKKALLIGAGALAAVAVIGGAAYAHHKGYLGGAGSAKALGQRYQDEVLKAKFNAWSERPPFIHPSSYDRKEFTLPAGHTFSRISRVAESSFGNATYATHNVEDANRYLGYGFGSIISNNNAEKLHQITFSAKKDVKVPNLTTVLDTLHDVMRGENSAISKEDVIRRYTEMSGGHWESSEAGAFFKALKAKGYGALVDEMDAGVVGDTPLVIFAHELMGEKKASPPLTIKQVQAAKNATIPLLKPKL